MKMQIPLCKPSIKEYDVSLVSEVLASGWLAHGKWNKKFEEDFCNVVGTRHAVAMNSCTSALEVALQVNGIRGEVIVPSMTWVATANCVINSGAKPVFCEVNPKTRNVTPETVLSQITDNTEAVIVVHFGGQPCEIDRISALCSSKGLLLIEDSAETLGAKWKDLPAGSTGIGCFSFFPTKNITTCEGGMLTCNDDEIADKARTLISHGINSSTYSREEQRMPWLRDAVAAGHNFRLPDPLAALGVSQLSRLPAMNKKRSNIAAIYNQELSNLSEEFQLPFVHNEAEHSFQMYTVTINEEKRDEFVLFLRKLGIGASVHFDPPVHQQEYYRSIGWKTGMLPVTELLAKRLVSLPIYPDMTNAEAEVVTSAISKFFK